MSFRENFILPNAIKDFIADGQDSAFRHTRNMSTAEQLANVFREYHTNFCTCSRHNSLHDFDDPQLKNAKTENLEPAQRRENFETMVVAAAAMCYIAVKLREFPNQEPILKIMREEREPRHKFFVDGTPQPPLVAETFYLSRTVDVVHPRILHWLEKILSESEKPEEQGPGVYDHCVEALRSMFIAANDASPTPVERLDHPPCPPSRAVAALTP